MVVVVRWPRGLVVLVAYSQRRYRYNGSRHHSQAQRGSHANEKFGVITHVTYTKTHAPSRGWVYAAEACEWRLDQHH